MSEKHNTGAATFDTHIEANNETPIIVKSTTDGVVPAFDKIHVDNNLAMLYLDNAAAKVKPPNNNKITEFHIVDNIYFEALGASIAEPSSFFKMLQLTIITGMNKEVTNNGIVSVAHSNEAPINNAKQCCCCLSEKIGTLNKIINTIPMRIPFKMFGLRKVKLSEVASFPAPFSSPSVPRPPLPLPLAPPAPAP